VPPCAVAGEDQAVHMTLTNDIAQDFNKFYRKIFPRVEMLSGTGCSFFIIQLTVGRFYAPRIHDFIAFFHSMQYHRPPCYS